MFQQVAASDHLSVELLPRSQGARLRLSLTVGSVDYSTDAGFDLDDNRWHDIDLRLVEGLLQVQLDQELIPIANSSDIDTSPLFKRVTDVSSPITLGQGYTGCLLEGPSVQFTKLNDDFLGNCPIPLIESFSNTTNIIV